MLVFPYRPYSERSFPLPLYEYKCKKCAHRFEKIESHSASEIKKCPKCGAKAERQIGAPAIQFKGSGWYVTDYGGKGSSAKSTEGSGDGSSGKSEDKSSESKSSPESKSSTEKSSDKSSDKGSDKSSDKGSSKSSEKGSASKKK
jgi:putative FmdB family regulatory protein